MRVVQAMALVLLSGRVSGTVSSDAPHTMSPATAISAKTKTSSDTKAQSSGAKTTVHKDSPGMRTFTVSLEKTTFVTVFNYSAVASLVPKNNGTFTTATTQQGGNNDTMIQIQLPGTNVTGTDQNNDGDVDSWSDGGNGDHSNSRNLKFLWLFFLLLPLALVCIALFACIRKRHANERRLRHASLRNQALRMDLDSQNMTEANSDIWYSTFSFRHRRRNGRPSSSPDGNEEDDEHDEPLPLYDGHESPSPSPEIRQATPPVYDEVISSSDVPLSSPETEVPPASPRTSHDLLSQHKGPSSGSSTHSKIASSDDDTTDTDADHNQGDLGRQKL